MGFLDRSIFEASKKRAVGQYYARAKEARKKEFKAKYEKKQEKTEWKKEAEQKTKDRQKAAKGLNKFFFG
jgi:hypothetical protein